MTNIDEYYSHCTLCPRNCGVDRTKNIGYCGMTDRIMIARADLHFWEEPCISGKSGSGAVFFMGCTMGCVFCQNNKIAKSRAEISDANGEKKSGEKEDCQKLIDIFFALKEKGANNINLVTADHFIPTVASAIRRAKEEGFDLPFVFNTSSYIKADSLKLLDGLIDVYLPDFKYISDKISWDLSGCSDYKKIAKMAIDEMFRQTGRPVFYMKGDKDTEIKPCDYNDMDEDVLEKNEVLIRRGVIVRHLILPGHEKDSKELINMLIDDYGDNIYISIMNQYTPVIEEETARRIGHEELLKKLNDDAYEEVIGFAIENGIENGFIQDGETCDESFIPEFDPRGI
ncbi:MAG: radical SAM protein [Lachnospiraceae bacterium]|nr:radical SAM protein [Lachnospiraceae bacterium]